jgi:hypothetical protein
MRMRKISWRMTSCYYPSCKHSHSALVHYTLLEMVDVFRLCVAVEHSVAPTNSGPEVLHTATSRPAGIISWSEVSTSSPNTMNFQSLRLLTKLRTQGTARNTYPVRFLQHYTPATTPKYSHLHPLLGSKTDKP